VGERKEFRARPERRAEEEDMPVGDFCRREPCTATADESIREAAKRMDARGVGCLVVVDAGGRPVGMLTDRDLVMRGLRRRRDPDTTTVGEVMHGDVTRVREAAPLEVAIRRMRSDAVRRIPVTDDAGRLVGILTADDVLQLASSELAGVAEAIRAQFPANLEGGHALPPKG
jgi:CBS domain-containing protein